MTISSNRSTSYHLKNSRKQVLLLVAGLLFQSLVALFYYSNLDSAILRLMPDDTFYYLKIAKNIGDGLGSVFSIGEPTNGYHPLWMSALVMLQLLVRPSSEHFILLVLMMAVVLNVLAATVFGRLLKAYGFNEKRQLLGIAAWLFLPWTIHLTLTGLETPLFFLCLFTFLLIIHQILTSDQRWSKWIIVRLGFTAGLLMLARTDAILFVAFAWLWILFRKGKAMLPPLILVGMLSALVLASWLGWNLLTFGTITQSSSTAISALHRYYLPPIVSIGYWRNVAISFLSLTYWAFVTPFIRHVGQDLPYFKPWAVSLLVMGFVVSAASYRRTIKRDLRLPVALVVPVIGLMTYYFVARAFIQVWHLSSLYILLIILAMNLIPKLVVERIPVVVLVLLLGAGTIYTLQNGYYYPQQVLVGSIASLKDSSTGPSGRVLCTTDAGYRGYFTLDEVVNIDGVVNNRASKYIMEGRLSDYLALKQCDVVQMDKKRLEFYDRNLLSDPRELVAP